MKRFVIKNSIIRVLFSFFIAISFAAFGVLLSNDVVHADIMKFSSSSYNVSKVDEHNFNLTQTSDEYSVTIYTELEGLQYRIYCYGLYDHTDNAWLYKTGTTGIVCTGVVLETYNDWTKIIFSNYATSPSSTINTTRCTPGCVDITIPMQYISHNLNLQVGGFWNINSYDLKFNDNAAPRIDRFEVNGGNSVTTSLTVNISTGITDLSSTVYYCVNQSSSNSGCSWSTTAPTSYTMTGSSKKITVYLHVKDSLGNATYTSRTMIIDEVAPKLNINPYLSSKYTGNDGYYSYYTKYPQYSVSVSYTKGTYDLRNYTNTSYYRYAWSTSPTTITGWTSTGFIRAASDEFYYQQADRVLYYVYLPEETHGKTWYLWLEGDVSDTQGNCVTNGYHINSKGPGDCSARGDARIFRIVVDTKGPDITVTTDVEATTYSSSRNFSITYTDDTFFNSSYISYYLVTEENGIVSRKCYVGVANQGCTDDYEINQIRIGQRLTRMSQDTVIISSSGLTGHYYLFVEVIDDALYNETPSEYVTTTQNWISDFKQGNTTYEYFNRFGPYYFDSIAPTIDSFSIVGTNARSGYTSSTSITINTSTSDVGSWVASYNLFDVLSDNTETNVHSSVPEFSSQFTITIGETQGTHKILFIIRDAANNISTIEGTIVLDTTDPILIVGNSEDGGFVEGSGSDAIYYGKTSKNLTVTFTDNIMLYSYSSTSYFRYKWCSSTTSCSASWSSINAASGNRAEKKVEGIITTPSTDGEYYLWIEGDAQDMAYHYVENGLNVNSVGSNSSGNRIFKFIVDGTAPTISTFNIVGNSAAISGYTNTTSVTYTITASDATSGLYYYQIKEGDVTLNIKSTTKPASGNLANENTGTHTLTLTIWDKVGNSKTKTDTIFYDPPTNLPSISKFDIIGNSDAVAGYTKTRTITYTITATDTLSGVYYYKIEEGSTVIRSKTASKPTSGQLANSTNGLHTLSLTIWDRAGNSVQTTDSIFLDTIAPVINVGIENASVWTKSKKINVTLSDDGGSELNITPTSLYYYLNLNSTGHGDEVDSYYRKETVAISGTSVSFTLNAITGKYYLFIGTGDTFKDKAGNNYQDNATYITQIVSEDEVLPNYEGAHLPSYLDEYDTFFSTIYARSGEENAAMEFLEMYSEAQYVRFVPYTVATGVGNIVQLLENERLIHTDIYEGEEIIAVEYGYSRGGRYTNIKLPLYFNSEISEYATIYEMVDDLNEALRSYDYGSFMKLSEVKQVDFNTCDEAFLNAWYASVDSCLYRGDIIGLIEVRVPLDDSGWYILSTSFGDFDLKWLIKSIFSEGIATPISYDEYEYHSYGMKRVSYISSRGDETSLEYYCNYYGYSNCEFISATPITTSYIRYTPGTKIWNSEEYQILENYVVANRYYKITFMTAMYTPKYGYFEFYEDLPGEDVPDAFYTLMDAYCQYFFSLDGCELEYSYQERSYMSGGLYLGQLTTLDYNLEIYQSIKMKIRYPIYFGEKSIYDTSYYERSSIMLFDNTLPIVTWNISNTSGGNLTNQNVTIKVSGATDAHSGVSSYSYNFSGEQEYNTFETNITGNNGYGEEVFVEEIDTVVALKVCDSAGNCVISPTTTLLRIDKTKPLTNVTIDKSNSTAVVHFSDNKSISDSNSKLGSSFEYYISDKDNVNVALLKDSQWIKPVGSIARGAGNDNMYIGRGQHYLYIKIPNNITDTAGNTIRDPYSTAISGYTVIKTSVTGGTTTPITLSNINSKARSGVQITGNYVVEIVDNFVIVTFDSEATLPNGFTMKTINEALSSAGYRLISVDDNAEFDFESSNMFVTLIGNDVDGSLSTQNDIYQLMVLINAPTTGGGNAGARVLEQGEELGNIAVAFTSDIEFSVDTLITLNGVKVKEVDTNKPGVYEVRSIATDIIGRVNKVTRTIVVKEGDKEELEVKVEEIKETPEVIAPVVVNNAPVEVQPEANANRKVVENIQVEMRIENKEEVKGYKKKEEKNKKNKENKGTFKLFSKWFFKVYDG